ncbi:hypothetical protein BKK50_09970 [Rodentibacter rarus]|uniref:Uncharacterized protein n=1 Tax=Rodentibacter rarus TaxID=1908260 RepID=A0A1V3IHE9_9PAST|nr:hypothetical protein [Rodentibacter rarus]OOF40057.1 hypothetical protein BKK50_09970 [Rodentibacter rarus]
MNKLITLLAVSAVSLSAFAELDPMGKYSNFDEVMRGTDFPIQDITVMKAFKMNSKNQPYSREILEKGIKVCKENNNFMAFKTERKHPSNYTELAEKRKSICSKFEIQLERMNR